MTPRVLVVDDNPGPQATFVSNLEKRGLRVDRKTPGDVAKHDIESASLVLIDFALDRWPERNAAVQLGLRPKDGLALAAVLRSQIGYGRDELPTAFALHSGKLDPLAADMPRDLREHALARIHNLEWVFQKSRTGLTDDVVALTHAVDAMPPRWPESINEARRVTGQLLSLPDTPARAIALRDIESTHPPVHELSEASQGFTLLRWLLHRILPYPTFLLDEWHLAALLGVTVTSLRLALESDGFDVAIEDAQYGGVLAGFGGTRWWRAGVLGWLRNLTDYKPRSVAATGTALKDRWPLLEPLELRSPVVCVDTNFRASAIVDASNAARMQLDDWPAFADEPWVTLDDARDDEGLAARIILDDRYLLES